MNIDTIAEIIAIVVLKLIIFPILALVALNTLGLDIDYTVSNYFAITFLLIIVHSPPRMKIM